MELQTIAKEVSDAVDYFNTRVITNNDEEEAVVEYIKLCKGIQKEVGDAFDPIVEKAHAAHKEAVAQRAKYLKPLEESEKKLKQLIKDYRLKLELERQKKEREEKEKLDAQVKAEQEALMVKAETAQAQGDEATANQLARTAVGIEAGGVHVESKTVKQEGMSSAIVWKGRVVDMTQVPQEFLFITPNQSAIDRWIKVNGEKNKIAGVEYYQDVNLTVRTK